MEVLLHFFKHTTDKQWGSCNTHKGRGDDKEECKSERLGIKVCDRIGRSKPSVTAWLSQGCYGLDRAHTHARRHTRRSYLTQSVIDTGLDLENHCHSSLCRSNSYIISHKGKRDGGNESRTEVWRREKWQGLLICEVLLSLKDVLPPFKEKKSSVIRRH